MPYCLEGQFFFRTKRGRLFEGGDYFKYCSLEIGLNILFCYPIKTRKIITYTRFFESSKFGSLINFQCQYPRRGNLNCH